MTSDEFSSLVDVLKKFRMNCTPSRENEIESAVESHLQSHGIKVRRQVTIQTGRLDLLVGKFIVEVKLVGQKNIAAQLDRYSGHCDGLIVICWRATGPLRLIFKAEKRTAKIPVELIEVRKACEMI